MAITSSPWPGPSGPALTVWDWTPIDPGDARGFRAPGYPAVGDTKVIDGHPVRFDGRQWQRTDVVT